MGNLFTIKDLTDAEFQRLIDHCNSEIEYRKSLAKTEKENADTHKLKIAYLKARIKELKAARVS